MAVVFGVGWRVMDWKRDLEDLIEGTMALVKDVRSQWTPPLPGALRGVEEVLAGTSSPVDPPASLLPILARSERDEIQQRVSNFKAHQEKMARDREDYYLEVKARTMAVTNPLSSLNSSKNPPAALQAGSLGADLRPRSGHSEG